MYDMKKKKNPSTTSWTTPSPRCRRPWGSLTCPWGAWNHFKSISRQKTRLKWCTTWRKKNPSTNWWTPPSPRCRRPWGSPTCPWGAWNHFKSISCQKLGWNDVRHEDKKIHQLIQGLHLVLVVDVHGGVDDEKKSWKSSFAVRKML